MLYIWMLMLIFSALSEKATLILMKRPLRFEVVKEYFKNKQIKTVCTCKWVCMYMRTKNKFHMITFS